MPLCRGVVIEKFGKLFKFLNREGFGNPPTVFESHQRQLVVRSDPFYNAPNTLTRNPTNGSWWIVQILSTTQPKQGLAIPPTAVGGLFKFFLKDLKYPPTAVGGIRLGF